MKILTTFKSFSIFALLLITNSVFSNILKENLTFSYENINHSTLLVDPISPTSGHAGTVVTITGTGFTSTSVVLLGTITIPTANVLFVSATQLQVTIPCGAASGFFKVDGVASATLFTYLLPTISTVLPNLSYCVGSTVPTIALVGTLTAPTTSTLQYSWVNSNAAIGLSLTGGPVTEMPTFTALNSTLEPITSTITVTPSIYGALVNGCPGTSKTYTITVNPKPVVTPISNISVCAGVNVNQINLTASSPTTGTGTSFLWSGNNNAAIGLSSPSGTTSPIPSFVAANTTNGLLTSTFTVTPTYQTCVGSPINFTIDVAPQSFGGTLSSSASICSGSTSGLLSLNLYKGAILNWESSTTGGAPWTSLATTASSYQSAGLTQTTYYRVVVQNPGCPVAYSNVVTITVNSLPTITGNLSVCSGVNTTLTGSATPATINTWQSTLLGIATITNLGVVTGVSPGTTVITYTNTNGCSATANFVVNALPVVFTTNPTAVCSPNTVNLNSPSITTGSTLNLNYTYYTNSIATLPLSNYTAVATSGTFYIKGTDANGCSSVSSVSTIVNSLPTIAISGVTSICTNDQTTLTASGAASFSWNSGLGTNASINVSPLNTTTYTVNATDNNGCVGTATSTVTVKPLPTVNAGFDRAVCSGQPVTLVGSGTAGTNYTWDNAVLNNVAFTPSAPNIYTVTGSGANGCFNTDSVLVTVNALPTAPILSAIQPDCSIATGTIQFSGLPTSGSWTIIPGSYNGSGSTFSLNNQPAGGYNFSVRDSNLCSSANTSITINAAPIIPAIPTIGTITQPSCATTTGSFVLSGLPIGSWTITQLPGGQTYTNTGTNFPITNLSSGTYTFSVSNGTCSSLSSQNVIIDATPTQSAPIVGLIIQPTCTTSTGSVTLNGLPAGNWTLTRIPDGVTLPGFGAIKIVLGLASGTYNYTVTNSNGCISSISNNILIDSQPASPAPPIANAQSFLAAANATVSDLRIVSSGFPIWYSSAVGGAAISDSTLLATGTYYVSQTVNGCESTVRTAVSVTVFPTSDGGLVLGGTSVCFGTNSTVLTLSGYAGSILNWESSTVNDFSSNVQFINVQSATYTATNLIAPLYFRAVVQSGTVAYSFPAFIDIVPQSDGGNLSGSTAVCLGQNSGSLSVSGYIGSIIRWEQSIDNGANWTSIINTTNSYTSGAILVTTQFRVVVQNGVCPAVNSTVATITLKSTPVVTDVSDLNVCYGNTVSFGNPVPTPGYSYEWSSLLGITPNPTTSDYSFTVTQSDFYTYTITNSSTGCYVSDSFSITMKPLPNATVISPIAICEGSSINIGANSVIGSDYSWTSIPSGFLSTNSNPSVNPAVTTTYILEETIAASGCKKSNQTVITVQPIPVITIVNSPQFNICETTTQVQLNSTVTNFPASHVWTKLIGSGSFDDVTSLNPKYSPSLADIALGSVTLQLSVIGSNPCIATYTENVVIIIDKKPISNAGLDVITCGTTPVQINATGTLNATNLVWSLPSGITGTLNQSNPYIPIFTPSVNDVGTFDISLTASSNTTCPSSPDTVSVSIIPAPIVDAGPPTVTICEGSSYIVPSNPLAGQNIVGSTILWTKGTGDGTFSNINSLTPIYTPGVNDILNGSVTLTLSASGNNPCNTPATDSIILTIIKNPLVNIGFDTTVCEGPIILNSSIQNAGQISWSSSGNGTFSPSNIGGNPTYIPDSTDLNTTVIFTVTVTPINGCGPNVTKNVRYTINEAPSVVAGGDATICQSNLTYQLLATSNTTLITWTTTGSGSFDNINNEDPIYTLSPTDIIAGSVTFRITGSQSPPCLDATDEMVLTIQKNPVVTADNGLPQVICQGETFYFNASSSDSSTIFWQPTSPSLGILNNPNSISASYVSNPNESGIIMFSLTANPILPCLNTAIKTTQITIVAKPTVSFDVIPAAAKVICEGLNYVVNSANASNFSSLAWSTNGDGNFISGATTLTPTYQPGILDKSNGTVILTLKALNNAPCTAFAEDSIELTITKNPIVNVVNASLDICSVAGVAIPISGPGVTFGIDASNYDNLSWSSSSGNNSGFLFSTPLNTINFNSYTPSPSDIAFGSVSLTITASRLATNCNTSDAKIITLNFIKAPQVDAGPTTATICENSTYTSTSATAINYASVAWSSNGTAGTIANPTSLNGMVYTPSVSDLAVGSVTLTLTAVGNSCQASISNDIIISFEKLPVINTVTSASICKSAIQYPVIGTTITNGYVGPVIWSSSGTGIFSTTLDPLKPNYIPSNIDIANGSVILTIRVTPISPCATVQTKSFVLSFIPEPEASAGPNLTQCDSSFTITTATANMATISGLKWTGGTGTFFVDNTITPTYTPTTAEINAGSVTLTLTAYPNSPCAVNLVSNVLITFIKSPVITVTPVQATICEDATNITVLGTTVLYASNYIWTSTTGTTISNNNLPNPIVTPSALDISNNQIVLTVTAQPIAPCGIAVSKQVTIPIQKKPIVFAGTSQTICENTIILTSDALSSNVTNLRWNSSGGNQNFTSSNLNTIVEYTPSTNDKANGQVTLTLIGDSIAPCSGTITSSVTYTIIKNPTVTINPTEVPICENQTYQVPLSQISVVNSSSIASVLWTTADPLSLTGSTTFTPIYTPTTADINAGFAILTLTVNPILPCVTPIVKTLKINISKQATITFTNDGFFCENISKPLSATFVNNDPTSISWTIVNGTGSITGGDTATPTYVPASDSGTVVIRISVASLAPCTNTVTKDFTITVVKKPIVSMTTTTDTVCSSQLTYNLSGNTTQFANSILWTRVNPVGTGTFSNASLPNPVYTFNAADIANGFVTLRLTASSTSNCGLTDSKDITINITKAPTVVTTPTDSVCQGSVFSASATATNNSSILWSTIGTSNGTFIDANLPTTQYTPGSNDINSFIIQVTAYGNAPCASVSATKVVQVQPKPILDAGIENRYNCSSQPYQITGVTGQNLGLILWTSNSGSPGTFSNASGLNPSYTPSAAELSAGLPIILTVTAQAVAPCLVSVSDFIILNLTPNQIVDAGTYSPICEGASVSLSGNVINTVDVNWTSSSGTGTFSAVNSVNTNYVPSSLDIINGTVTLTLHATSNSNCPEVTDTTVITIKKKPIANAGANVSICQGSSYTLLAGDASAQNYSSITWTATGPGILYPSTINPLTPTYVPAIGQTGIVTLTLTANGYSECGINAVSLKTITIVPSPFATIPSTKTICEGEALTLSSTDASAINYSSLLWSSNGLGSFTPNNTAATIYTPASGQTGSVTLSLTAISSNGVCPSYVSSLLLDIIAKPVVIAGTNGTICQSQSFAVTGASVQNSTLYSWSVSGPATIKSGTGIPNVFPIIPPVIEPNAGASGTVTVTLTAIGTGICNVVVSNFLTIQINPIPEVNAGLDGTLCEGISSYQLNGTATASNANSYTWTTTGDGTIQQTANPLAPIYIPSASDFNTSTGVKIITINLKATTTNGCSEVSNSMLLTLYAKPKIDAGLDAIGCQDLPSVNLAGALVTNYNSGYTVSWGSSGNGTWDYTDSNGGVNPHYIFGSNDISSVTLTMSVLPNASCPQVPVTDTVVITINQNPTIATLQNSIIMCGETFTMPDLVTVNNADSILWTNTSGASGTPGVLTNANSETPIFTPSANEIANGFALLTLTAQPLSGCSIPAVTVIKVNLKPKAIVNAGVNIEACQGDIITFNNGALVQNYNSYIWSENGTGTIDPLTINTLNPRYTPGVNETGIITFTLQATNLTPCSGLVTQTMTVTYFPKPTVNAGPDITICQNTNYFLGSATVSSNTIVNWTSSQTSNGTNLVPNYLGNNFSNPDIINATYTPSQDDINLGYVFLTVTASSASPNANCNSVVTDVIKITLSKLITVFAGSDATICEGTSFSLASATSLNATSLVWTSSQNSNGTSVQPHVSGTFTNNLILNPSYTPSLDDIDLGYVYLTLTGSGSSTCPNDSSQIKLSIIKKPTVSTTDIQMCMDTPQIPLVGFATNYETLNWSIFSGPGTIISNSANELNPTFISGISGLTTVQTTIVRLFATPKLGCTQSVFDDLIIKIQPLPTVEAGINGSVCYTSGVPIAPFAIVGSSVTNGSLPTWSSSNGLGTFSTGTPVLFQSASNSCTPEILTLTANGVGACSTSRVSDTVTLMVNCSIPTLGTITGIANPCQGTTVNYSIPSNPNVLTYTWTVPTRATIQSGQGTSMITVFYPNNALSGNVVVTASNGCGNVIATLPITINSLPTGVSITGLQSVCASATNIVYTATLIPNASYIWTLPNGSSITTTTNTITLASIDVSGNLSVSGSNTCGSGTVSAAFPITLIQLPTLTSSLTPPAICSRSVFNYVPTSVRVGTIFTWTRAQQTGITPLISSGSNTINEVLINTTINPIQVQYQVTITSQGCTNTQTVVVTVNPAPSLISVAPSTAICSGTLFNYTPVSASIGNITWVRNAVSGIVEGASNGTGIINETLTNSTTLPITVTYLLTIPPTLNGCSSVSPTEINLIVNPSPQVAVNSLNLCFGTSQLITATPGTSGTYSYTWTVPSGVLNPGNTSSFSVNTAGTYSVVITNTTTLCSSTSASGTVTIVPLPIVTLNSETICAGTTTTLLASPSSVGVYTYTWTVPTGVTNPGNATSITSGVSGIYGVSIKDTTTSCSSSVAFGTITVNPLPIVSVNNPSTCAGANAIVTATPATPGTYTYAWTVPTGAVNPGNIASFSTSTGGVYSVIITNTTTTCSSVSVSGTVTLNPIPTVTVNSASICAGLSTTISATPGFAGTYSYVWTVPTGVTDPGNVASFSASVAGTYSVIITNSITSCISASASGIIIVNPIPLVTVNNGTVCDGFTTTLNASPNPIGNYTYTWTVPTGVTNPGNATSITSGVSGIYGVSIKDTTTNCISLFAFGTITVNPLPIVSVNNPFTCAGANAIVTATPSTIGTYTYAWTVPTGAGNPGNVASFSTSIGGVYSVIITNTVTACSSVSASGTVTLNPIPTVTVNSANVCAGLSTTISATPDFSGTYSYAWTVPTGVTNPGNVASFSASVAGTYSVIITNSITNCISASASGTITIVPLPIVTLNSETICAGTTTTLIAVPSSVGNYIYTWTVPTGVTNPGNATSITSGVSGTYGVSIKDTATNCISLFALGTITVNSLPIVSVNNPSICAGANAIVTATPSTIGTFTYAWTVPTGVVNPGNVSSFSTSIGGVYSVIITNTATTCSSVSAFGTVTVNPIPTVTVNSASICAGLSTTISATPGFSGTYSYAWTVPTGVTNPGNAASFSASVAGTYSVIITNSNTNCISTSASGIITVNPIPLVTVNSAIICAGFTTTITATAISFGNYNYAWTVPTGATNPGNSTSLVTGIAGNYSVIITDTTTNCSSVSAFGVVTVNPLPIVAVNNPSICAGSIALITATPSTIGLYNYVWTVPTGAINPGNSASFSSSVAGNYAVIITNITTNCSSLSAVGTVTVNPIPTVTINNVSICAGSSTTITAIPGFAGTYSYVWTVPAGSSNPGNSNSFTASVAGTYSVIITNTITNCVSLSTSGILTVNPIPIVTLNSETICAAGAIATLTATPNLTGSYIYVWTVPIGALNPGNNNSITTGIAGTYSVIITDTTTNCSSISASGTINFNQLPIVTVNNATICAGESALVIATPSVVGSYSYVWTVPNGVLNPGNVASFSTSIGGTYSVVVTNTITTCFSASVFGNVTVNPIPVVSVNNETICAGSSATLVATPSLPGTYSYAWIVPAGANNPGNTSNFSASIAGIYSVVITNLVTNCSSLLASGSLIINPLPIVNITNPSPICAPNTVDLTTTTTGSSTGLTFGYWNDSSATIAVANPNSVSISGTYFIKGTNAFGCSTVKPVVVIINPSPMATISGQNSFVVCQNGTQPIITFTGSNGTAPYTFSYRINLDPIQTVSSLATSNSISVVIPTSVFGNYTITLLSVQDSGAALCSSSNITLPNSAFVEVQQMGTIIPVNQTLVSQIVCQGNPILPIVFTIGGASTNAYVTNLPPGLNGVYNLTTRTLTISGTPIVSGVFNYVVHTSGSTNGCNSTYGGTITVNSNDSITALTPATINQTVCSNVAIQSIVYSLGGGATGGIVTFSPSTPAGITWNISPNNTTITISGVSNTIGTFTYTVQSFGLCGQSTASGTLTINENVAVALVSGNPSPTICSGTSFATPIQYSITSATATIILSGALPTGVTFNLVTGIISGTPSQSGSFPYTITSSTGCGNVLSGVITVNPLQTISYVSGNTNQVACQYSSIDPINFIVSTGVNAITISPALPAGISYSISSGILTISGTPTSATSLAQNFTITTQGTCGPQAIYSVTFDIRPEATITLIGGSGAINQAVCQSSAIVPIRFTIGGGATGIIIPTLPPGLTLILDPLTGIYTIQGNPLVNGIFNFPITTTGCPKTLFITISNVNTAVGITLTSAPGTDNQTLCQTNFNSPIVPIVYTIIGATSVNIPNLPVGVTYVFSPTTGQLIISGTPLQAGIFNYTITSLPCSIVKAGVIRVSTPMFITNEVVTNVSCSSSNDGAISVTIVGGVSYSGLYALHWSGPNGFQQNQTTITGLQPGQYVLTGTDAIGCPIPTMTYTVLPAQPINIALQSSTNVSCNGILGCANFNITGGSGIYTSFTLQYLDPGSQTLVTIMPANNNYFNICNLNAGLYYLTVKDSKNCSTAPYLFTIYDYSSLSIESITLDDSLCQDMRGKVRIKVNSLDPNLTFYYNSVLVPFVALGNNTYEVSIDNPTVPNGIIKVKNGQNCWVTETVSTAIITPDFSFTSNDFQNFGYYSVNGSVQFTNLVNMSSIPAEYDYIVWDFGDNTPFKVFYNPEDLLPNAAGENFETVFHTYTTNGIYQITLTVYNQFGCFRKVTKTIIIGSGATMMLPTIFTPNNDGINDMFRPSLIGLKDVAMYIYDDWGNLVYEVSSDVSLLTADWGWNGIEKGQSEARNNDYRYYIIATTINDKKLEKEGRFLLVK